MDSLTKRPLIIGLAITVITYFAVSSVLHFVFHLDARIATSAGSLVGMLLGLFVANRLRRE